MLTHWFQNASLKRKQMFIILLTTSVALLLACAAFIARDALAFRREMVVRLTSLAEVVGNNTTAAIDFNDADAAKQTLAALRGEPNIVLAHVHLPDGRLLAAYLRDGAVAPAEVDQPNGAPYEFRGNFLHLFHPIMDQGERVGTIQLIASLDEFRARLWRYFGIVFAVLAASLLAAFWLSNRLQRVVSGPILHLVAVARQVAQEKNYSLRAAGHSGDELGQLIDGFNEMLGQIQQRDSALQSARDHLEARVQERTTELAASFSLLNATFDSTADGILALDTAGHVVSHNTQFATMWNLPPELLLARDGAGMLASVAAQVKDPQALQDRITSMQADPEREFFGVVELKDGRTFEEFIKPQRIEGRTVGMVVNLRDITARKQAEARLAEASSLMETLLAGSLDFIYFKDRESRFVRYSRTLPEHFGLADHESLKGRTDFDCYADNRARAAYEDEQEIIRTGRPIIGKLETGTRTDGRVTWVLTSKMPWRDADGAIRGTFGISKDVTALKEAEIGLAYERELLRALMDKCPDQIYFKDAQSRFIRCSASQAAHLKLLSPEEMVGRSDFDFFAPEHAQPAFDDEQEIIRTGRPIIGKTEMETFPDGRITWVLTSKLPFHDLDGRIIGTFGISKNITAIKEAEARLAEAHKQLLEASRLAGKAEVATSVLHNVGNVLNSINVSTFLLADRVKKSKAGSVGRLAALMRDHAHDLGDFITNDERGRKLPAYVAELAEQLAREQATALEELAGLEKNVAHVKDIVAMQQSYAKVSGVTQKLKVTDVVEDALRMNDSALLRHNVELVRDYAPNLPEIIVDQHKVLQILVNLMRNAKYACDDAGTPGKQITVRLANGDGQVKISVIDNGIGIPSENLARIFNHGFTTRKEGHGFGLHSGALAAREMGGELTVHSDGTGQGACFTLRLPLAPGSVSAGNPPSPRGP